MSPLWWLRGVVWLVVGAAIFGYGLVSGHPLVLQRTRVPWGLVLVGIGLLILAYDSWRDRRRKHSKSHGP